MKLTYDLLPSPILFTENTLQTLVIENPIELRRVISLLQQESQGEYDGFYLSEGNDLLSFPSAALLLLNPFELDYSGKKLKNALYSRLETSDLYTSETYYRLLEDLNRFAQELSLSCDFEVCYSEVTSSAALLKLFDFRFDLEDAPFAEKILSFIRLQRAYGDKKLFIFLNLKAFLSEEEFRLLAKSLYYEKIPVLLIEDHLRSLRIPGETCTIVDKDLCIL